MSDAAASDDSDLRNIVHSGTTVCATSLAVAAGRLMNLTQPQMAQAIALSATSMGGLHAAAKTSVAREYHAGLAAMLGVNAAQAAGRGFLAEENILETARGFFEVYGNRPDVADEIRDFGKRWSILTDMGIKVIRNFREVRKVSELVGLLR